VNGSFDFFGSCDTPSKEDFDARIVDSIHPRVPCAFETRQSARPTISKRILSAIKNEKHSALPSIDSDMHESDDFFRIT